MIEFALDFVAAIAALLAGFFWFKASAAMVAAPDDTTPDNSLHDGLLIGQVKGKYIDLVATIQLQAKWNYRAALAAYISAFLYGLSLLLFSDVGNIF